VIRFAGPSTSKVGDGEGGLVTHHFAPLPLRSPRRAGPHASARGSDQLRDFPNSQTPVGIANSSVWCNGYLTPAKSRRRAETLGEDSERSVGNQCAGGSMPSIRSRPTSVITSPPRAPLGLSTRPCPRMKSSCLLIVFRLTRVPDSISV
jgi:hypothetical protein